MSYMSYIHHHLWFQEKSYGIGESPHLLHHLEYALQKQDKLWIELGSAMAPPFFYSCPPDSDTLFLLHQTRRRERGRRDEEDGIDCEGEGKEDEEECEPFHIKQLRQHRIPWNKKKKKKYKSDRDRRPCFKCTSVLQRIFSTSFC